MFAIYFIFFTALFILELAILWWLTVTGLFSDLSYNEDYAGKLDSNHRIVSLSMIYSAMNFLTTMHALFMFERMSRAVWSNMLPEEQKSTKTSQMDREVAAGWFDEMLVDTDYKFVNFLHNIPYGDDTLPLSQRSSQWTNSFEESFQLEKRHSEKSQGRQNDKKKTMMNTSVNETDDDIQLEFQEKTAQ